MFPKKTLTLVVIAALAACSGAGSSGPGTTSSQPGKGTGSSAKAMLKIIVPARKSLASMKKHHPLYVSPSSEGILAQSYPHGSSTPNGFTAIDISPSSPDCTGNPSGSRTCLIYVPAPIGDDDFVVTDYDEAPVNGGFTTRANILAVGTLSNVTIVANQANNVTVYLQGRPMGFDFLPSPESLVASGSPSSYTLSLLVLDQDGNVITAGTNDPYEYPVLLTIADSCQQYVNGSGGSQTTPAPCPAGDNGHSTLSKNGGSGASSQTTEYSSDTFTVNYDGGGLPGNGMPGEKNYLSAYYAVITASDYPGGVPPSPLPSPNPYSDADGTAILSPLFLTGSGSGYTQGYPATIQFTASNQTVSITLDQLYQPAGGTAGYGVGTSSPSNTCGSSVTIVQAGPDSKDFTVTSNVASGTSCVVDFTDGVSNYPVDISWN